MKRSTKFEEKTLNGNVPYCRLESISGNVLSIMAFCDKHPDILNQDEQSIVFEYLEELTTSQPLFNDPVILQYGQPTDLDELRARPSGARSALIDTLNLKIKGCTPEKGKFPNWVLNSDYSISVEELPYGVLTAESVMREILGFCFMKKHGHPFAHTPVEIFEYHTDNLSEVYALVSSMHTADYRLENYLDYGDYTLHDLVRLKKINKHNITEIKLKGMDKSLYLKRKADLLISINFAGGFRGVLNSNIGNDVIHEDYFFGICDFDSFKLMIPEANNLASLKEFVVQSFLELIKTSLPFADYLDLNDMTRESAQHELASYYKLNSGLFQVYSNRFTEEAKLMGWCIDSVKRFIDDALLSEAGQLLLNTIIPNSRSAADFDAKKLTYVPHNIFEK